MTVIDTGQAGAGTDPAAWLDSLQPFAPRQHPEPARRVAITPMQANVLESLCEGKDNAAIGADWGISENTVKTHLKRLFAALGAGDRAQVIAMVLNRVVDVRLKPAVHATQGATAPYPPPL